MNDYLEQRMYELDSMMFNFGFEVINPKGVQQKGDPWYDYWSAFYQIKNILFPAKDITGPRLKPGE